MTSSVLVHRIPVASVPVFEIRSWRDDVLSRHRSGARVLTMYGRRSGDDVLITSVFRSADGAVEVTRAVTSVEHGYHELTSEVPALHCFERELHEQTGVRVAGHPWLKPIRYEGGAAPSMNSYPFYRLEGKEVHEVAVGPIHAGVIEPGAFRFSCLGEQVHHLEIHLGYQHRGVEPRLLASDARRLAPLVETIAGDTSVAHAWAYCAALESLAGCELDLETEVARAVALELERVAMHLGGLSGMSADIGFLQGATTYGRLRTTAINTSMRLCGSRFGRGAVRPGGVGMKLPPDLLDAVGGNLELLQKDLAIINELFLTARTVDHRLADTGVLGRGRALDIGVVGMAARASGLPIDLRQDVRAGAYEAMPIALQLADAGDCKARAWIRIAEMNASLAWLRLAVSRFPRWERPRAVLGELAAETLAIAAVEGWRGEVVHCLETDGARRLLHYKVQDPSLRNWLGLALAVRGNEISDFPICNKSFDLSYCGNDL